MTFGLATLPLIGGVGAAVDISHANSVKSAMQGALDSTALMISKNAATLTSTQLQNQADAYFKALFTRSEATNVTLTATYSNTAGSQVVLNSSAKVPTTLMGVFGYNNITVTASATAKWGTNRLRVALVLDNTGSMAQAGKMNALITATKNLLTQLHTAASVDGDIYVSIVPFVKDVNVSSTNYNATWIDWTDWKASNGTCTGYSGRGAPTDQSSCTSNHGTWRAKTPSASNWSGCVMDRGNSTGPDTVNNYDTNAAAPSAGIKSSLYPAESYSSCPQVVKPLSYDWAAMTTLVNGMTANGNTNQAIGLQLGWMSLVGGGPFPTPPAEDPNYQYSHVIILLTDGLNTEDRWYTSQSAIDARQQLTCNNFKAASTSNILYTIQVNTGGDPTSTLLQNCASSSEKFYLLTSASQILTAFNEIGTNLTKLRVAR